MIGQNLHTHSLFSDGKSAAEEIVKAAIQLDMHTLGFSDHAPVPFENGFSIQKGKLNDYIREVKRLQHLYKGLIQIYLSLEIDYIPGLMEHFMPQHPQLELDYAIASVHLVGENTPETLWFIDGPKQAIYDEGLQTFFGGDIRKGVTAFYRQTNQMIEQESFDILGHFDKINMHNQDRYFREDEKWYRNLIHESLRLIREKEVIVEVNTRALYKKRSDSLFPSEWILSEMHKLEIPVIISSDAHHASELQAYFEVAIRALKKAGYQSCMHFKQHEWVAVPL